MDQSSLFHQNYGGNRASSGSSIHHHHHLAPQMEPAQWRELLAAEETRSSRLAAANSVLRETQQFLVDKCTAMSNEYSRRVAELEGELARRRDSTADLLAMQETVARMENLALRLDGKEAECAALRHELDEALDENEALRRQVETLQETVERLVEAQQEAQRTMRRMAGVSPTTPLVSVRSDLSASTPPHPLLHQHSHRTPPPPSAAAAAAAAAGGLHLSSSPPSSWSRFRETAPDENTHHFAAAAAAVAAGGGPITPLERTVSPQRAAIQEPTGAPLRPAVYESVLPMMAALRELGVVVDTARRGRNDVDEQRQVVGGLAGFRGAPSSGSLAASPCTERIGLALLADVIDELQRGPDAYYETFEAVQRVYHADRGDTAGTLLEVATITRRVDTLLRQAARAVSVDPVDDLAVAQPVDLPAERILEKLRAVEEENAAMRAELEDLLQRVGDEVTARELLIREDAAEWRERAGTILAASENLRSLAMKNEENRRWKQQQMRSSAVNTSPLVAPLPAPPTAPPLPANYTPPLHSGGVGRATEQHHQPNLAPAVSGPEPTATTSRIFQVSAPNGSDADENPPARPIPHLGVKALPKLGGVPPRVAPLSAAAAAKEEEEASPPPPVVPPKLPIKLPIKSAPTVSAAVPPQPLAPAKLPLKMPTKVPVKAPQPQFDAVEDEQQDQLPRPASSPSPSPSPPQPPTPADDVPTPNIAPAKAPLKVPLKKLPAPSEQPAPAAKLPLKLPVKAPSAPLIAPLPDVADEGGTHSGSAATPPPAAAPKKLPLKLPVKSAPPVSAAPDEDSAGDTSTASATTPRPPPPAALPLKKLPVKLPMKAAPPAPSAMPSFDEVDDPDGDAATLSTAPASPAPAPLKAPPKVLLVPKKLPAAPGAKMPLLLKKAPPAPAA